MTDEPGRFAPNAEVYGPGYYERMYRPHWFLRNRRKYEERDAALLRIVRPSPSARLLEVGSARGDTAFFLAPRVAEVVGIDAAKAAVAAARTRLAALALENVRFEEADARDLSTVSGGPFDVVVNTGSMQEMTDDWIAVYERFLSAISARYFYSANYFLQPIDRMNEAIGKAKQGVGEATGSDRLKGEGADQEIKGKGQQAMGDAKDAAKEAIDRAAGAAKRAAE